MKRKTQNTFILALIYLAVAAAGWFGGRMATGLTPLRSGMNGLQVAGVVAFVLACTALFSLATQLVFKLRRRPAVEGFMLARLYWLVAALVAIGAIAYGFGVLGTFGTAFSMFGGMLLGWSLQAPVSGFAAWVLVSLKRPFRPGDRVQFPSLGLTGDIMEIGPMYTVLNQVGGSIASEEAVGRHILVPNAMLFGQVVINYTATREASFMLDEVVVRITYDSDWRAAEKILLDAAKDVTADVIEVTKEEPYIRADLYDYGVYLRLRYRTRVKDRAETSYLINKRIFEKVQRTPTVDLAIPYIYSYRSGHDRRTDEARRGAQDAGVQQIEIARIRPGPTKPDSQDVEQLSRSIAAEGLLQPVILALDGASGEYEVLAGELRLEACRHLGWTKVPALIHRAGTPGAAGMAEPPDSGAPAP
ncbi:MAG: ParB N-terminal domain-containing protein [Kiritimatiellia bacterium]|jgi:small-conductance mechanosensitive channel